MRKCWCIMRIASLVMTIVLLTRSLSDSGYIESEDEKVADVLDMDVPRSCMELHQPKKYFEKFLSEFEIFKTHNLRKKSDDNECRDFTIKPTKNYVAVKVTNTLPTATTKKPAKGYNCRKHQKATTTERRRDFNTYTTPQYEEHEQIDSRKILKSIFEELKLLIKSEEFKIQEGGISNITGCWTSSTTGYKMKICYEDMKIVAKQVNVPKYDFLNGPGWKFSFEMPFHRYPMIIVKGINQSCKKIAIFLGEMDISAKTGIINGQWMIGRNIKDYNEGKPSFLIFPDTWKKRRIIANNETIFVRRVTKRSQRNLPRLYLT